MKIFLFAIAWLLFGCSSSDKETPLAEGTIEYGISYEKGIDKDVEGLMSKGLTVKLKKNKLYLKLTGGIAEIKPPVIVDMAAQEALFINYFDSTVLPKSLTSLDYGKDFEEAGKGETILGYPTTRYKAGYGRNEYTIDAADAIPVSISNTLIVEGFYLSAFNKLPLQVKITGPGLSYRIRAKSVHSETVPDSVFAIPKGFKPRRP